MRWLVLGALLVLATPAPAQWSVDPDWRLWAKDSREHFAAGAALGVAARLILPNTKPWQRVAACSAPSAAWELAQADKDAGAGWRGRGHGIGVKDWLLGTLGCAVVEWLWRQR